jgi:hypothetical protein
MLQHVKKDLLEAFLGGGGEVAMSLRQRALRKEAGSP